VHRNPQRVNRLVSFARSHPLGFSAALAAQNARVRWCSSRPHSASVAQGQWPAAHKLLPRRRIAGLDQD